MCLSQDSAFGYFSFKAYSGYREALKQWGTAWGLALLRVEHMGGVWNGLRTNCGLLFDSQDGHVQLRTKLAEMSSNHSLVGEERHFLLSARKLFPFITKPGVDSFVSFWTYFSRLFVNTVTLDSSQTRARWWFSDCNHSNSVFVSGQTEAPLQRRFYTPSVTFPQHPIG